MGVCGPKFCIFAVLHLKFGENLKVYTADDNTVKISLPHLRYSYYRIDCESCILPSLHENLHEKQTLCQNSTCENIPITRYSFHVHWTIPKLANLILWIEVGLSLCLSPSHAQSFIIHTRYCGIIAHRPVLHLGFCPREGQNSCLCIQRRQQSVIPWSPAAPLNAPLQTILSRSGFHVSQYVL